MLAEKIMTNHVLSKFIYSEKCKGEEKYWHTIILTSFKEALRINQLPDTKKINTNGYMSGIADPFAFPLPSG